MVNTELHSKSSSSLTERRELLELTAASAREQNRAQKPTVPDPHAPVPRARRQEGAIVGPGRALDLVLVALQVSDDLEAARVLLLPNDDGRVEAGRGELAAARRPAYPADGARVSVVERGHTRPLTLLGDQLGRLASITSSSSTLLLCPDADGLVAAARG